MQPQTSPMVWAILAILPTRPDQQRTNHINIINVVFLSNQSPAPGLNFPWIQR